MSETLKIPYEISVWEDELVTLTNGDSYYQEKKKAIIGSDTMTSPSRVFDPVLKVNVNGEVTLTFSLQFRYFDEKAGEIISNPIYPLLINERKVKLFYKNKWYDFIIKECEEDKQENIFTYTAKDIFVNELSKQGYGIEFDPDLNNNCGTVIELGKRALENTGWVVDEKDSDLLQQTIDEPLYICTVKEDFSAKNITTGATVQFTTGEIVYVFYSYVSNLTGSFLQFIAERDLKYWTYDDEDIIIGDNYRIEGDFIVDENSKTIKINNVDLLTIGDPYLNHQAYRLVYQQRTLYDPVMEQYVDLYTAQYYKDQQEVYHFKTTEYGTAAMAIPYVTQGTNFSTEDNGGITGWDAVTLSSEENSTELVVSNYPPLGPNSKLVSLTSLGGLTSYLRVKYPNVLTIQNESYCNTIFNSGFMNMGATIGNISKGEKYVFRVRGGVGLEDAKPVPFDLTNGLPLKAFVAFYRSELKKINGINVDLKTFSDNDIIFKFDGEYFPAQNIISNGKFDNDKTTYVVDQVVQTPSLKYCYREEGDNNDYIWEPKKKKYVLKDDSFLDYYAVVAEAKKTVSGKELIDPQVRIGIFIGITDEAIITNEQYVYLEDVEIFRYLKDGDKEIILPGNVPTGTNQEKEGYYLKPTEGATKESITIYYSKQDLLADLGIEEEDFISNYNDNCEKILTIKESKSNCFNILQTLCETFECWLKITVEHEENGAIKLDGKNRPIKKISFKKYVGKENFAGFRYGINLNSITRSIDSNEVVTKLIVADTVSDYAKDGVISIALADSNPTGEQAIYNLDYYLQRGLLKNKQQYLQDLGTFYEKTKIANNRLQNLQQEYIKASTALNLATSNVNVYTEAQEQAEKNYVSALEEFEHLMGCSYEEYLERDPENSEELGDEILEIIGKIYSSAGYLNNNGGVTTNCREEYKALKLKCDGAQEYSITVSTSNSYTIDEGTVLAKTKLIVSDYIEGLRFSFEKDGDEIEFKTSLNDKQFEIESETPYDFLNINYIPDGYKLEYTIDGKKYNTDTNPTRKFEIYDSINEEDRIRRFTLVPNSELLEKYPGYNRLIDQEIEKKNEYVQEFEQKYSQFIQEGTWESSSYIDSNLYYFDALQVSHTSARPQVSYTINVAEVSEIKGLEGYSFSIGEKTYIEDTEFFGWVEDTVVEQVSPSDKSPEIDAPEGSETIWTKTYTPIKEEVILSEIEWHLDNPSENIITIQNYKTQFEDLFQRISATVQSVQYNEANYSRAANILGANGQIDSDLLVKSLASLSSSSYPLVSGGAIEITDNSLIVKDLTNQKNYVRLLGRGLQVSTNGGKTWRDVLTAEGITTDALQSGSINTQNVTIMDGDNTSFRWDKNGLSAYGFNEYNGYNLKSFVRMDKYGLYGIKNGDEYVVSSLDDLLDKAHFSLTWDGFRIRNSYGNGYVGISSDDDFEVVKILPTRGNEQKITKVKIGALEKDSDGTPLKYGININNDEGETVFTTGDDGNITITGTINAAAGNIGGFKVNNELYSGKFGQPGSIYLSPGHNDSLPIGGLTPKDWVITAGENFGVTSDGILYSENAVIKGTIYADNGEFTGHVNAESGNFRGNILVGNRSDKYITINSEGQEPIIASSDYVHNTSMGWMINGSGDALFNNVSVRGAIKTAVFEYSEIEAVGGAFLFRPSSSIKTAEIDGNDIVVTVEKPQLFHHNEWVKLSNCLGTPSQKLDDGGLTHVYKIGNEHPENDKFIILLDAAQDFSSSSIFNDDDYYYYDEDMAEQVNHDPDDTSNLINTIYHAENNLYYEQLENIALETDVKYHISYDFKKYFKKAQNKEVVFRTFGEEGEFTSEVKEVVYIGNLAILNSNLSNTGETFLIISYTEIEEEDENENEYIITRLITSEEERIYFTIEEVISSDNDVESLVGGALISFGYYDSAYTKFNVHTGETPDNPASLHLYELQNNRYVLTEDEIPIEGKDYYREQYENGANNYGIGINSSDNYVGLPERAISLFESKIHPNQSVKVTYDYKGILGTLPPLGSDLVNQSVYSRNMAGTQGIFTNNMYIGDNNQYLAFYTDQNGNKQLKIKANQIVYEVDDQTGEETTWDEHIDDSIPIRVEIESSAGVMFLRNNVNSTLTCTVYKGNIDITSQVTNFIWQKKNSDGTIDNNWSRLAAGRTITISNSDIDSKAIFICTVEF